MAHQLDFHVTLWSDDKDELLLTEQMFKQFETNSDNVGGSNATKRLHALSLMLGGIAFSEVVSQADIHSVDINWDEFSYVSEELVNDSQPSNNSPAVE